ncbi:MAG: type IV secretion system DNA-binding domain-containing protein [Proteobacteria bacterium]|nr:type IV secretion system DNA-binding domain-containing protein [Pseudomonadota bacterium]
MTHAIDSFGGKHAPSQWVRHWDSAAVLGSMTLAVSWLALQSVAWALPGLADVWEWDSWIALSLSPSEWWLLWWTDEARLAIAWLLTIACGLAAFTYALRPRQSLIHIQGGRLLDGRAAIREARRQAEIERRGKATGWLQLHPSLDLPKERWTRHLLVYGSVGSGKTQILLFWLRQVMDRPAIKLICYDVKGDFTAKFPGACLISPWDRRSAIWDIGVDLATPVDASAFAQALVKVGQHQNSFFEQSAQAILYGAILSLQATRGKKWGWTDLHAILTRSRADIHAILVEHYPRGAQAIATESNGSAAVMGQLAASTRLIDDLARAWGTQEANAPRISFRRWCRDDYKGETKLIVQAGPDPDLSGLLIGTMIKLLESWIITPKLADNELGRDLVFCLDEYPSMRVDVSSLVAISRSKGVSMWLALQSLAQLDEAIGENNARALTGMVGTHVLARIQVSEDRQRLAELFGRAQKGIPGRESTIEDWLTIVPWGRLSDQLGWRKARKTRANPAGFVIRALVSGIGPDILELDWPGQVIPDGRRSHSAAAWTKQKRPTGRELPAPTPEPSEADVARFWAACAQGDIAQVDEITRQGTWDFNRLPKNQGHDGSPLHIAAEKEHRDLALWLLEHGVDPNAVNSRGETADQVAALEIRMAIGGWRLSHL